MKRQRELDFLRGIAIILVLFRHQTLFAYTENMGYIGVDLFFVLSGFLVSGLLFKEYLKHGDIKPVNFLIRRGFKIYPIYYLSYVLYLIPILAMGTFKFLPFFSDMIFIQNYVNGWGYAYSASWSLAVEEHFYFGLAIFMSYGINNKKLILKPGDQTGIVRIDKVIYTMMIAGLVMRFLQNYFFPDLGSKNFTMTHLRIDSLLAGVLVSYWYHFRRDSIKLFFDKNKRLFLPLIFALLSVTPFFDPLRSYFVMTIGFSMLYTAFGMLLIYFLLAEDINDKLDKVFTKFVSSQMV